MLKNVSILPQRPGLPQCEHQIMPVLPSIHRVRNCGEVDEEREVNSKCEFKEVRGGYSACCSLCTLFLSLYRLSYHVLADFVQSQQKLTKYLTNATTGPL